MNNIKKENNNQTKKETEANPQTNHITTQTEEENGDLRYINEPTKISENENQQQHPKN